jgi:hypothetical protein
MYIFFEGVIPVTRYGSHFLRRLRPSMYSEDFRIFIYGFLFIFCVFMDYVCKKCIYMCMIMIFLCVSKMPI